eukprot:3300893-Amphidinium_carterae.1
MEPIPHVGEGCPERTPSRSFALLYCLRVQYKVLHLASSSMGPPRMGVEGKLPQGRSRLTPVACRQAPHLPCVSRQTSALADMSS